MKLLNLDVIGNPPMGAAAKQALGDLWDTNPPSPLHGAGESINAEIIRARKQVAALIHGVPDSLVFTASGSEALNLAVKGLAWSNREANHLVLSAVEHTSVLHSARFLERLGYDLTIIPVDFQGRLDLFKLKTSLGPQTCLVAVNAASNEIGTIQHLAEIGSLCANHSVPFVVDAVVAAGRMLLDVQEIQATAVALSGHQWGGPKGAGALWLKPDTRLTPLVHGGIQENGLRAGTENVAGIIAMGAAAAQRLQDLESGLSQTLRERACMLREALSHKIPDIVFTGHPTERLPGHISCLTDIDGESLVLGLALQGILASTGSTCSRADLTSHVLKALGLGPREARGSLVCSLDTALTEKEIQSAVGIIAGEVNRLRAVAPSKG